MKQCETCLYREYKDDLICCNVNHLHFAFREMLKSLPLIGKDIHDYECKAYEMDRFLEIKEKMKNKDFKKAIYQGFNSHDCEAYWKCPTCGRVFGSWSVDFVDGHLTKCPFCGEDLDAR